MQYTDNLDNYESYLDTQSCYLDGRYFNMVFHKYPGLVGQPLQIRLFQDHNGVWKYEDMMKETPINNNYPGLVRVVTTTPTSKHASLLIIDYKNANIYRFDPYGRSSPDFDIVNKIIEEYFDKYIDFDLKIIENQPYEMKNPFCLGRGVKGGFCTAYVIKYGYDYLNGRLFDPSHILKFSSAVEHKYGKLPETGKEVAYGLFSGGSGRNAIVGVLGGAALGGLLTGSPGGILIGGIGGGLIGSMI